ncbi:MAG TPA: acyl carrier protein [Candidatus Acidoferrales bacterium]|jgi:acyl carrier protein|nr:acyl carrier protein [Candidatus Acidoferrales bacterium]
MQTTDIERDIRSFLVDQFFFGNGDDLRADASLLGTVIDSTGILVLVTFLQDHFGITVEDEEVVPENLESVNNVVAYVGRKLQRAA